jgi:hypothetical protein
MERARPRRSGEQGQPQRFAATVDPHLEHISFEGK